LARREADKNSREARIIQPQVKTVVKAVYTPEAKAAGIQGTVL
jgi:hypothetical protein